ncbi:MAG TPA: hypothetical protein EYP74_04530 [Anaerolineales bacterium]|nr:hypothetical protein [Anaerolineales bacterium]
MKDRTALVLRLELVKKTTSGRKTYLVKNARRVDAFSLKEYHQPISGWSGDCGAVSSASRKVRTS